MSQDEGQLEVDYLSKGLTRPAMLFGVSLTYFALNIVILMSAYIVTQRLVIILVLMPLMHGVGYAICFKEPLFLELLMVKASKCNTCPNKIHHGGNSYDVF